MAPRSNQEVWTLEHERCCWNALQAWRALSAPGSGALATLAWCAADALHRGREMERALVTADPGELTEAGCESIAERIGCDPVLYRELRDSATVRKRARQPDIRGKLTIRARNQIINQLFASHFVRWARQHFRALGELRSADEDERCHFALCYLNSRVIRFESP